MDKDYLRKLREAAHDVIEEAQLRKGSIDGVINWAALRCVETRKVICDDGREYYEVFIAGAAEINQDLEDFLVDRLAEMGHYSVYIGFEW